VFLVSVPPTRDAYTPSLHDALPIYQVDDSPLHRLRGGDRSPFPHRVLGEPHVAAASLGDRDGEGGGVVDHLVGDLTSLQVDGSRRPDGGGGRHRRHVGGHRDERAGGGGPRTLGRHVDDHR